MMQQQTQEQDDSLTDFNLQMPCTPFSDSISSIQWMPPSPSSPNPPNIFAVTTWDGTLRVYEVVPTSGTGIVSEKMCIKVNSPIHNCCWNADTNTSITLACVDGFIRCADLASGSVIDVGKHNDPVNNVFYMPNQNAILSIGYDKVINFWQKGNPSPVFSYTHN